ncbi:MAG: hypothetical protein LQ351_004217 [Letrouitia transgressa]|nr:MAG: hypothetical protein LQ351_004217 [Letrouitia transgressa]
MGSYGYSSPHISSLSLPDNPAPELLASGLLRAHSAYGPPKCNLAFRTGILFIVQSNNVNICDERPLEEILWNHNVPSFRLEFNRNTLEDTRLTPTRELLFHGSLTYKPLEISVVYMRAGYDEHEYHDPVGIAARVRLESSRAIKCPSLLSHLTTFKKVQQELTTPGTLERFLSAPEATRLSKTFMPMYPLDGFSSLGQRGRALARDPRTAPGYILKPNLEGGGHNIHGAAITNVLRMIPERTWNDYIIMEQIKAPEIRNSLVSSNGLYSGEVVTELGIFGVCLWSHVNRKEAKLIENKDAGFSLKTKSKETDEMSVVKGYGCFDSPLLLRDIPNC